MFSEVYMTDKQWLNQLADDLETAPRCGYDDSLPVVIITDELVQAIVAKLRKITQHSLALV